MANQHCGSFEHKIQERFQCTARDILKKFAEENLSYYEVEQRVGFTHGTIRKWARRYGIHLRCEIMRSQKDVLDRRFFEPVINSINFLSRRWGK